MAQGSWSAIDGTVTSGANTNSATIRWNSGPVVGKAIFTPVEGLGFKSNWEVNVVRVDLQMSGETNRVVVNTPAVLTPGNPLRVDSVASGRAMTAALTVNRIEGPIVNGVMRGLRYIQMGFVQTVEFSRMRARYFNLGVWHISPLEGKEFGDWEYRPPAVTTPPWMNSQNLENFNSFWGPGADPATAVLNVGFSVADTPRQVRAGGVVHKGVPVDWYDLKWNFMVYFAVRTTEAANDAAKVYTQRAKASWSFVGWGRMQQDPNTLVWTWANERDNVADPRFTEVISGQVVPITTGPSAYSQINGPANADDKWFDRPI